SGSAQRSVRPRDAGSRTCGRSSITSPPRRPPPSRSTRRPATACARSATLRTERSAGRRFRWWNRGQLPYAGRLMAGAERRPGGRQANLLAQYLRIKAQHAEAILLFRLGDFYEMFFDDARIASAALDLTLTARNRGDPDEVPLCGFPAHAAQPYVTRLLAKG